MRFKIFAFFKTLIHSLCIVACLGVMLCTEASAQILDDSTKQIYSTKTTKYVLEEDILSNNYEVVKTDSTITVLNAKHHLDTILDGIHNAAYTFRGKRLSQDLGNYLSPIQDVYFQAPMEIGKQLGYNSFDRYAIDYKATKYYDTRSPYSKVDYVQGTRGQQGIVIDLSRNIVRNWNIGIDLRRQTSKKILGSNQGAGGSVKALESNDWFLSVYTRFYSKNERYHLLANFTHGHQVHFNNGGIKSTRKDSIVSENFKNVEAETYFTNARSIDKRVNYHLFQELQLLPSKRLQLYLITDYTKRAVQFSNNTNATSGTRPNLPDTFFYAVPTPMLYNTSSRYRMPSGQFKKQFNFSTLYTDDRTDYHLFENQAGVKGEVGNLDFRFYYRRKDFTYRQLAYTRDTILYSSDSLTIGRADQNPNNRQFMEDFVGSRLRYAITSNIYASIDAEYLLGRDYRYALELGSKKFLVGYSKIYYSPTLVQLLNTSNVRQFSWNNIGADGGFKFLNTQVDKLQGQLIIGNENFRFQPGASYEIVRDLVYYDTLARPAQAKPTLTFASADLFVSANIWRIHIENYSRYTHQNIDSFWVVPKIYTKTRLYYTSNIFKKAAQIQFGADAYWRSTYKGAGYMPVTHQFYNNYNFELKSFLQVDVFLNMQIKNASIFLKYAYINGGKGGYFITPGYTAIPNSFDFGIRWMFFD